MLVKRTRFAARRKAVGFSQDQFAERLKVDRSTVARWESGGTEPQPWVRPRLARVLQVSLRCHIVASGNP
jgi:transcriptional regulator with XRE-family HTH domain